MDVGMDETGLVCGQTDKYGEISDDLKEYSARKLKEAEIREQEMLEKPLAITCLLASIKNKFKLQR